MKLNQAEHRIIRPERRMTCDVNDGSGLHFTRYVGLGRSRANQGPGAGQNRSDAFDFVGYEGRLLVGDTDQERCRAVFLDMLRLKELINSSCRSVADRK